MSTTAVPTSNSAGFAGLASAAAGASAVFAAPVSADPAFVGKFGSLGVGAGQLNLPQGLAIDPSDDVLVADENSNRVDEFTTAGGFVKAWGFNVAGGGVSETCVAV